MKVIYLLTNSCGLIPQRTYERESLDLQVMSNVLSKYNLKVIILSFDEFINNKYAIEDNYFFYASSQFPVYKEYIQDILMYIQSSGGCIIPNFNAFLAHENKNFQVLEMKRLKIISPKSFLTGTYEEGTAFLSKANFPLVAKKSRGFGSKTVKQINSVKEGEVFLRQNLTDGFVLNIDYIKWLYKKWKFTDLYPRKHGKVIFQEMIEDLEYDWKVLIFGTKCFVLKRFTKKNDFRASGSGLFDYTAVPPDTVLDFALDTIKRLNVPFASLDIVESNGRCFLIEYQSVHFGLLTALNAKTYYRYTDTGWVGNNKDKEVDYFFASAIGDFIELENN